MVDTPVPERLQQRGDERVVLAAVFIAHEIVLPLFRDVSHPCDLSFTLRDGVGGVFFFFFFSFL